jgi:hypothetical protein
VDAVDAAQGPKVEDDDLAAEVLELDRAGGVEPGDAAVEFGGVGVVARLAFGLGRRRFA